MIYTIVYGDRNNPKADVILCDTRPERTPDGTIIFHAPAPKDDVYIYPGDCVSCQCVCGDGTAAAPENLYDIRAGSPTGTHLDLTNPGANAVSTQAANDAQSLVDRLDSAADYLRDALDDAHRLCAYDTLHYRRNQEQDDAIIRVQEAQQNLEEHMEATFADRYDLNIHVTLEVA